MTTATPRKYTEYFWGDKHVGYAVLYEHFKAGEEAAGELEQFVKETATMQEDVGRMIHKSTQRVSHFSSGSSQIAPAWLLMKGTLEVLHEIQTAYVRNLHELAKELTKYRTDLAHSKKRVKEGDIVEAVSLMQTTTTCLQKAKETYTARFMELEKLRSDPTASAKEHTKAEHKLVRAREEYHSYVDKYETVRVDFEAKMEKTADAFQAHDRAHLTTLKNQLLVFANHQQEASGASMQVHSQLLESLQSIDVDALLDKFVEDRGTGMERPMPVIFESLESSSTITSSPPSRTATLSIGESTGGGGGGGGHSDSVSMDSGGPQTATMTGGQPQVVDLLSMDDDHLEAMQEETNSGAKDEKEYIPHSMSASFSASLGGSRQKLAMWLPGKRKKTTSVSSGTIEGGGAEETGGGGGGFLNKFGRSRRSNNKSKTDIPGAIAAESGGMGIGGGGGGGGGHGIEDTYSTASSSKSDDKPTCLLSHSLEPSQPTVDEEGYTIRRDEEGTEGNRKDKDTAEWASCSSSEEEDDTDMQRSRIRALHIRPAESAPKINASVDELRDAVGHLLIARSSTFDKDPWSASTSTRSPFSQSLGGSAMATLRPSYTGGDERRANFNEADFTRSNVPLNFSASLSFGQGMARARPRGNSTTNTGGTMGSMGQLTPSLTGDGRLQRHADLGSSDWGSQSMLAAETNAASLSGSTSNLMQAPIAEQRVPIAAALNEYLHVWMKEESRTTRIFGTVLISFAASSVGLLTDSDADIEPLHFVLDQPTPPPTDGPPTVTPHPAIKTVVPNKQLLHAVERGTTNGNGEGGASYEFAFDRPALSTWLQAQRREKPSAAFFNVEVVRYELSEGSAPTEPPLLFNSYWKTTMLEATGSEEPFSMSNPQGRSHVDLRIDFRLNPLSTILGPLINIHFATKLHGPASVSNVVSDPMAEWDASSSTLSWRLSELSRAGGETMGGSLKARVYLNESSPAPAPTQTTVQFQMNDSSVSGARVSLRSSDTYHLSMARRKILAGKYFCEPQVRQ